MAFEPLLERMPTSKMPAFSDREGAFGLELSALSRGIAGYKIHGGCGLMGICDESGELMGGEVAIRPWPSSTTGATASAAVRRLRHLPRVPGPLRVPHDVPRPEGK